MTHPYHDEPPRTSASGTPDEVAMLRRIEREILQGLRDIRYGSIEIVIQDSRVVQIERREKVRLDVQSRPDHRKPRAS